MIDRRRLLSLLPAAGAVPLLGGAARPASARAMAQEIVTPGGLRLWLVEEHAAPLLAIRFGFPGGSTQDPEGQEGLTAFLLAMLEEGAGPLGPREFKDALKATGAELSFSSARDRITGGIVALERSLPRAAELLRHAVTAPRLEPDAIARVRRQLVSRLAHAASDSGRAALDAWYALAFAGHPYARSPTGTEATLGAIGRDGLAAHHRRLFTRTGLCVVMVGSIGAGEAARLADDIFGGLPADGSVRPIPPAAPLAEARRIVVAREQPQSAAVFGLPGRATTARDFAPALVLNHILGSGDFDARLVEEVRVRRGLTYSIRTSLVSDSAIAVMLGQLSTRGEAMGEALGVIGSELARMAREGPTAEEVANARSTLSGSLLLGFDGNTKLADALIGLWLDGHGRAGFEERRAAIEAVTREEVAAMARGLLRPDAMTVAIVGRAP